MLAFRPAAAAAASESAGSDAVDLIEVIAESQGTAAGWGGGWGRLFTVDTAEVWSLDFWSQIWRL